MQRVLFVTKTRSGFGSHVVLTQLVRGLRERNIEVDVLVSEHQSEHSLWRGFGHLWDGINPEVIAFSEHESVAFGSANPDAFSNYDDVLLNDDRIVKRIRSALNSGRYTSIVLDSWYIAYAGVLAGAQLHDNVVQLVQSEPEFVPENREKQWKVATFKVLAHMPLKRIFISKALAELFEVTYGQQHPHTGFFVDDAFHAKEFIAHDSAVKPFRIVSTASNFNLPNKGLKDLLDSLSIINAHHFPIELSLICTVKIDVNIKTSYPVTLITDAVDPHKRANYLKNHDLYVTTTRNESPGLAQAEAIALGMPSVALDSNGNRDYYTGKNFLMAADTTELIEHIVKCRDIHERRMLGQAAKISMHSFTRDSFVQRFMSLLTKDVSTVTAILS